MNTPSLRFLLASVILLFAALSCRAEAPAPGFRMVSVQFYLPDQAMRERLPEVRDLGDFVIAMQKVCTEHFAAAKTAEGLSIVTAVKPNGQARFWFVSSLHASDEKFQSLREKLAQIPAPKVRTGPVAFALDASIAGGAPERGSSGPPMPKEWQDAIAASKSAEPLLVPDGVLKLVWPE